MDPYWGRLLDIYNSLSETLDVADRWRQAYRQIREEKGTYREPGLPPSFDPPAQTLQEFAEQYAEAMVHMNATLSSHLELPKDFMTRWLKAEDKAKKED